MPFTVRAIEEGELPRMQEVDRIGFGAAPPPAERSDSWHTAELERTRVAFDRDEMVGVSRAYSFELTMPGGRTVPAAAVSSVAVLPTHRRRGILRGMLDALHADARERGEPVAILTASESSIYGRFGYGLATWRASVTLDRTRSAFAQPVRDDGRIELVDEETAKKLFPEVYERVRLSRAGMVSRPDYWWPETYWTARRKESFFFVVHRDSTGVGDGFASYSISGDWENGLPDRLLNVADLQSATDTARAALWRYLCDVDLVAEISAWVLPVDDPLRFLLADPRRLRVSAINDALWLCPLDPSATLASRTYSAEDSLVVEVRDHLGERVRLEVDGGPAGASCRSTTADADLACASSTLGALALGGNTWSTMRAAALVDELRPGAVARADAMFATAPAPAMLSWF
jgi:predicted acetyltransferase